MQRGGIIKGHMMLMPMHRNTRDGKRRQQKGRVKLRSCLRLRV